MRLPIDDYGMLVAHFELFFGRTLTPEEKRDLWLAFRKAQVLKKLGEWEEAERTVLEAVGLKVVKNG